MIEVIVVIGIISIIAGMLVPMMYRVWESQEIETTEDRITRLKEAMTGGNMSIKQGGAGGFGFVGELGQLPPDLDSLISYTNINGTFGPFLGGGIDPDSFKKDAWGYEFSYSFTTDAFSRRETALLTSLGSDNAVGGTGTAGDIQLAVDANEVFPASSVSSNVLLRYVTPPATTFDAAVTVYVRHKDGEGLDMQQSFSQSVTITGNVGNTQNNYVFGINSAMAKKIPVGVAAAWASIDKDSSGNALVSTGPLTYVTVNDRETTVFLNNLSVSVQ